ncbi:thioredoxin family protein [Spongiivirga sp. MCCC 1A20706]|uniref:thioredoxin family protein n=1 Tax=Spongiivirga sp. MCCC 1A20706 TaxID=3160963 RepID=UPI003977DFB9
MKNNILLFLFFIVLMGCKSKTAINITVPDPDEEYTAIMVGPANRAGLEKEPFSYWFGKNANNYVADDTSIQEIKPLLKNVSIKLFMGTWCEDSQREVPNFYKIMDAASFNYNKLELIAVTRDKTTPQELEKGLNIINVPTIILYKDGKEINRIVEFPIESLEKDMLAILSGNEYKHAYAE